MATYEQMIENLADWREVDIEFNQNTDRSSGYADAIADMFGKDKSGVIDDMCAVLKKRQGRQ